MPFPFFLTFSPDVEDLKKLGYRFVVINYMRRMTSSFHKINDILFDTFLISDDQHPMLYNYGNLSLSPPTLSPTSCFVVSTSSSTAPLI